MSDYHGQHRPLQVAPLHDLTQANGEDIYTHPEWFSWSESPCFPESVEAIRKARNNPNGMVTIYRSAPNIGTINRGDWVTLSPAYAKMHGTQQLEADDWPVYSAEVPVESVWWDGSDLHEFGYWGPSVAVVRQA